MRESWGIEHRFTMQLKLFSSEAEALEWLEFFDKELWWSWPKLLLKY